MSLHPRLVPIFGAAKPVIAMIHVAALPGTPRHSLPMREIVAQACAGAQIYYDAGIRALMIENMHDVPYLRGGVGPEIVAGMTMVAQAVRAKVDLPLGLQILAGADREALAVAHAAELSFVRVECFTFAHVADEGLMQSNAAQLLRYRRQIGAEKIQIWADIKKKHSSHAITSDISLADAAEAAEFMGADALIITGTSTGKAPQLADVKEARKATGLPLVAGSGVSAANAREFLGYSDAAIVGSDFKQGGNWCNAPSSTRIADLLASIS